MEIARDLRIETQVRDALRKDVAIASVGPVMTAMLEAYGLPVDIVPSHPKMGPLVKAASEEAAAVLCAKRTRFGQNVQEDWKVALPMRHFRSAVMIGRLVKGLAFRRFVSQSPRYGVSGK